MTKTNNKIMVALHEEGYLCTAELASAVEACLATRPIAGAFLFGPAGSGKSYLPQVLGKILNREVIFFQCFPGTREDDLLMKLIPDESTPSGIRLVDGPVMEAAKASVARPIFLVLDEWDKTRPSADSFLLDFLQSGRIRYNGRSCTANTQNLTVWVTMNDERELSEPLLRRLPLIQFSHLPSRMVREALLRTHAGHPYLEAAVVLYERCLMAGMPKPATIQELRQLLDAITTLGQRADWNSLVFQFVTKTRENHALLKRVEGEEIQLQQEELEELSPEAYEPPERPLEEKEEPPTPRMPRVAEVRGMTPLTPTQEELGELPPDVGGVVQLTDTAYDTVVGLATEPTDDPRKIGSVAEVRGEYILLHSPIPLRDYRKVDSLWGQEGEVVFVEPKATMQDVLALRQYNWKVVKYTTSEVLAKREGADLRWTPQGGAEIVCSLNHKLKGGILAHPRYDCSEGEEGRTSWHCNCGAKACGKFAPQPQPSPSPELPKSPEVEGGELQKFVSFAFKATLHIWGSPKSFSPNANGGIYIDSSVGYLYPDSQEDKGQPKDPQQARVLGLFKGYRAALQRIFSSHEEKIRAQYEKYVSHTGNDFSHLWRWAGIDLSREYEAGYRKYLAYIERKAREEAESA